MTQAEEKQISRLFELLSGIQKSNEEFKNHVTQNVAALSDQVSKKHTPLYLEGDILNSVQTAITTVIGETLKGYNSPLTKLIASVVESRSSQLREIISTSFDQVISTPEFKQSIVSAFSHKVAKTIISNNDGLFDKVSNELKQDAIFKSKMQLATSRVVEECLNNPSI